MFENTFVGKIQGNYKAYPHITGIISKSISQISKLVVYPHITYIHPQAAQFSEMTSPVEKRFYVIE
jgi:hypothetical protein